MKSIVLHNSPSTLLLTERLRQRLRSAEADATRTVQAMHHPHFSLRRGFTNGYAQCKPSTKIMSLRDQFNKFTGKTQFVVARIFLHLGGEEVSPLLGILNQAARQAIESDGDLTIVGEGLVEICQNLLQYDTYWRSAANEGDILWDEGEAGDYASELFTDSAGRYLSEPDLSETSTNPNENLTLTPTRNLILMLTVVVEGEEPSIEADLADMTAMKTALKSLINLHYQERLRAIYVHFSPAQFGDELTDDQVLQNFPELIPL